MTGRFLFRTFAVLLLVAVAVGLGAAAYNAGVTAGLAEAARQAAASGDAAPIIPYAWGYGPYVQGPFGGGFGFFGFVVAILVIFLVIGIVRAAFGGRRDWGGPGRGPGGWGGRREMVEEWHRELHRREGNEPEQRSAGA
jgi:hypothetical protein